MPAGFDLVVDYGAGNQVCKLKLPALMPTTEKVHRVSEMRERMDVFLAELVPDSMRGLELGRLTEAMSRISVDLVEYEHVAIRELKDANEPFKTTLTVTFKNAVCKDLTGQ